MINYVLLAKKAEICISIILQVCANAYLDTNFLLIRYNVKNALDFKINVYNNAQKEHLQIHLVGIVW